MLQSVLRDVAVTFGGQLSPSPWSTPSLGFLNSTDSGPPAFRFFAGLCYVAFECEFFFFFNFIDVELIYNVVLILLFRKWLSYTYIYIFHILFHYGLSQDIEYSSLCYRVGPCCWSILYILVSWQLLIPNSHSFPPSPPSHSVTTSLFSMAVSLFVS